MGPVITLTSDFGLTESYAAAVKGAILSINSQAVIVDITHQIPPQNIHQAAFVFSTVYKYFPSQTIHLVIVDPGVGTKRRAIILKTPRYYFIAPDNGVLSYIVRQSSTDSEAKSGWEAIAVTNSKYWHSPVSPTFHGRDIFAPVAAHLSLGVPMKEFGEAISSLTVLPFAEPHIAPNGSLIGQVIHIDTFGNLIANIKETDLPAGELIVRIGSNIIRGLSKAYTEGEKLVALIGSSGYLEIALREGNAAAYLNAKTGTEVTIRAGDVERSF
jgi:S-adenosylmethionine hydrolase